MPGQSLPPRRSSNAEAVRSRKITSSNSTKPLQKKRVPRNSAPKLLIGASACVIVGAMILLYAFDAAGINKFIGTDNNESIVGTISSALKKPGNSAQRPSTFKSKYRAEPTEEEQAKDVDVSTLPSFKNGDNVEIILDLLIAAELETLRRISECTPELDPDAFDIIMIECSETTEQLVRRAYRVPPMPLEAFERLVQSKNVSFSESFSQLKSKIVIVEAALDSSNNPNSKRLEERAGLTLNSVNYFSSIAMGGLIESPGLSGNLQPLSQINSELRSKCRNVSILMEEHRWRQASRVIATLSQEIESALKVVMASSYQPGQQISPDVATNLRSLCNAGDYIIMEIFTLEDKIPDTDLSQQTSRIKSVIGALRPKK